MRPTFDKCLSLRIDAAYVEIERIQNQPRTSARSKRLRLARQRLRRLLRKVPV